MWLAASTPKNATWLVESPMKNDRPSELHPPPFVNVWNTSDADPRGAK